VSLTLQAYVQEAIKRYVPRFYLAYIELHSLLKDSMR
jgi:hypothetical protein